MTKFQMMWKKSTQEETLKSVLFLLNDSIQCKQSEEACKSHLFVKVPPLTDSQNTLYNAIWTPTSLTRQKYLYSRLLKVHHLKATSKDAI